MIYVYKNVTNLKNSPFDTFSLLSFLPSVGNSSTTPATPSNTFLKTVDEIEKSLYDAQAMRLYYNQTSGRLKKINDYISMASKNKHYRYMQQILGHGLYTTIAIEKMKTIGRNSKKRCSLCSAVKKYMDTIRKEIGPAVFEKFIGVKEKVSLMFAIDDTGSMRTEIGAAKAIATHIVNHRRNTTIVDYILSPFNDPSM